MTWRFPTYVLSTASAASVVALVALLGSVMTGAEEVVKTAEGDEIALLFVQSGTSGSFDGKRLTLEGVGSTVLFSDRPVRIDGHMFTAAFIKGWDEGSDSFAGDPPNADLSILAEDGTMNAVVELTDPRFEGTTLSYAVKVSDGKIPPTFGTASLFIDHHGAGGYLAAGLGGAMLGSAVTKANDNAEYARQEGAGYSYRTAAPAPCECKCG